MSLRIDRASFLSLTFGMAAGLGCNTGGPAVAANVVDIPQQPPQPDDGGVSGAPERPAEVRVGEPSSEDGVAIAQGTTRDADDEGAASPVVNAAGCGWVDPKTVTRPQAACNDDQGIAPPCNTMKACAGFPFPRDKCESYRKFFKPQVAQKAVACLSKLGDKQVCDACNAYRCGDQSLKVACVDASVDGPCTQITTRCRAVSMAECRTYLSGLNAAGRARMVTCLGSKTGCGFGIFSCSESL